MSKTTSCTAIDELYARKYAQGKLTKDAIPKFRQKVVIKRADEIKKLQEPEA